MSLPSLCFLCEKNSWSSKLFSDPICPFSTCWVNPLRLVSPPPPPSAPPLSHSLSLSPSRLFPSTWTYRGVSKQLPLTQIIGILILQLTLFSLFSFSIASFPYNFRNTPFWKNAHYFSPSQWAKKSFLPLFPLLQFFTFLNELCQLFTSKELNHPVNPTRLYPWFY